MERPFDRPWVDGLINPATKYAVPFALSEVSPAAGVAKQTQETGTPFALSLSKGT